MLKTVRRLAVSTVLTISMMSTGSPAGGGAAGHLLGLNKHDDKLMVFEAPTLRRIARVLKIAVTPDGTKAYISNVGDRSITVVDLRLHEIIRTLRPERVDFPHGMAVSADGRHLLLTSEDSRRLFLIDVDRDVILRGTTSTQTGMHMVAMPPKGNRAYVANRQSDTITVVDVKRLNLIRHFKVGPGPEGIAVSPDGRRLVVALQHADEVIVLKPGSDRIVARLPAGDTPVRIAITPDSRLALVANRHSDDLTVIDLVEREVRATIPLGDSPGGIAIEPSGLHAYVCNNESNTVSVVSIPDLRVTGEITAGAHPDGIVFVPARSPDAKEEKSSRRSKKKRSRT